VIKKRLLIYFLIGFLLSSGITVVTPLDNARADFSGSFAPGNWSNTGSWAGNTSSTLTSSTMTIIGPDGAGGNSVSLYKITIPSGVSTISFTCNYISFDSASPWYDPGEYINDGATTTLINSGSRNTNYNCSKSNVPVTSGKIFTFQVRTTDGCCGGATMTITNFTSNQTSTITYSGNANSSGNPPSNQTGSGSVTLASNTGTLAKTGSYFDGWNTAADGSGTSYAVGASYTLSASVTLYARWVVITLTTINSQLYVRGSITATATPAVAFVYSASGSCTVNASSGLVTFTALGSCTITATYGGGSDSKTFTIIDNLTQRIISRTGVQPIALSTFIPPPYLTLPAGRSENVYACLAIVGATGPTILTGTNLNISLFTLSGATMSTSDTGKSYIITGTLAQVQAALSTLKINSTSGRIMAANSGSIYLRVRANLIADATTDAQCLDIGNDGRITLYQYTSDQIRRKNVPQKSGSTP